MGWRPQPVTKKYKTFQPYRMVPYAGKPSETWGIAQSAPACVS